MINQAGILESRPPNNCSSEVFSKLAECRSVGTAHQVCVDRRVHVFRDESHSSVSENHLTTAGVPAAESSRDHVLVVTAESYSQPQVLIDRKEWQCLFPSGEVTAVRLPVSGNWSSSPLNSIRPPVAVATMLSGLTVLRLGMPAQ